MFMLGKMNAPSKDTGWAALRVMNATVDEGYGAASIVATESKLHTDPFAYGHAHSSMRENSTIRLVKLQRLCR